MKKFFSIIAVIALMFSMTACMNKEKNNNIVQNPNNNVVVDNNESAVQNNNAANGDNALIEDQTSNEENYNNFTPIENFEVYAKTQTLKLPESLTDGIIWSNEVSDNSVIKVVKDEFEEEVVEVETVSVVGSRVVVVEGLKEGETTITFKNAILKEDGTPVETVVYTLKVDANKNVAIMSEEHS